MHSAVVLIDLLSHQSHISGLDQFRLIERLQSEASSDSSLFIFADLSPFKAAFEKGGGASSGLSAHATMMAGMDAAKETYTRRGKPFPHVKAVIDSQVDRDYRPERDLEFALQHALIKHQELCMTDAAKDSLHLQVMLRTFALTVVAPRVIGSRVIVLFRSHGGVTWLPNAPNVRDSLYAVQGLDRVPYDIPEAQELYNTNLNLNFILILNRS